MVLANSLDFGDASTIAYAVTTGTPLDLRVTPGGMTLECWVYVRSLPHDAIVMHLPTGTVGTNPYLRVLTTRGTFASIPAGSGSHILNQSTNLVPLNTWTHIATRWTDSDSRVVLFVNGVKSTTTATFPPDLLNVISLRNLRLGQYTQTDTNFKLDGKMSEVRIWSRPLTDDEILANYNHVLRGDESGLAGYWPLRFDSSLSTYPSGLVGGGPVLTPTGPVTPDTDGPPLLLAYGTVTFYVRTRLRAEGATWLPPVPPPTYPTEADAYPAILAPGTRWTRRAEVYEQDAETLFLADAGLVDGNISVDGSRDERRTLQVSFSNQEGELDNYPGGFWYDKVIKIYRGIELPDGREWEYQIGEFVLDTIQTQNFPGTVAVTGRDYTKRLLTSKFPAATQFAKGTAIETVVRDVALNGGIIKYSLPITGKLLGKDFLFEKGTTRWKCISDICEAYGYEVYFDAQGYLRMREFLDPVTSPLAFTFLTGPSVGNLAKFTKKSSDTRLYNHVVVYGQATDSTPVWGEAINTEPSSPTNVDEIGDRVYEYSSPFLTTTEQCQDTAFKFLKVTALEQFNISLESLVFPWLEANSIVRFVDPDPNPADPDRYLLQSFNIPIKLGSMSSTASRVTIVG